MESFSGDHQDYRHAPAQDRGPRIPLYKQQMYQDATKHLTLPVTKLVSRSRIFPGREGELLKAQLVSFQVWPKDFALKHKKLT